MKAVVAAFNQEKALVGAFSVITNLLMDLFQALFQVFVGSRMAVVAHTVGPDTIGPASRLERRVAVQNYGRGTVAYEYGCIAVLRLLWLRWGSHSLVLQTDPSVKLYNHGDGPY